jgi:hypothetical protein
MSGGKISPGGKTNPPADEMPSRHASRTGRRTIEPRLSFRQISVKREYRMDSEKFNPPTDEIPCRHASRAGRRTLEAGLNSGKFPSRGDILFAAKKSPPPCPRPFVTVL